MVGRADDSCGAALHVRVISARDINVCAPSSSRHRPYLTALPSRSVVRIGTSESKILPPPLLSTGVSREDRAALRDRRGVRRAVQEYRSGQHLVARVGRGRGRASDPRLARWLRARDNLGSHVNVEARPAGTMRRAAGPHRD